MKINTKEIRKTNIATNLRLKHILRRRIQSIGEK